MQNIKKIIVGFFTLTLLIFSGCSSGGSDDSTAASAVAVNGVAQKGPFLQGSVAKIYKLDANYDRNVSQVVETTISNDDGAYSFATIPWTGLSEIEISGFFLDENTGDRTQSATITSIVNVTADGNVNTNVNVLTHMASAKVKALLREGKSLDEANEQVVGEVFGILGRTDLGIDDFGDLDLTDLLGSNATANTELLLLSAALLQSDNYMQDLEALLALYSEGGIEAVLGSSLYAQLMQAQQGIDVTTVVGHVSDASDVNSATIVLPARVQITKSIMSETIEVRLYGTEFIDTNPSISFTVEGGVVTKGAVTISDDNKSATIAVTGDIGGCKDVNVTLGIDYMSLKDVAEPLLSNKINMRPQAIICAPDPDDDTAEIVILPDNQNPVAYIGTRYSEDTIGGGDAGQEEQHVTTAVGVVNNYMGEYSYDRDLYPMGAIVHCQWENNASEIVVESDDAECNLDNLVFDTAGVYDYTLKVRDNRDANDSNVLHITVGANTPPTVTIKPSDRQHIYVGEVLEINATVVDTDVDDTVYMQWLYTVVGSPTSRGAGSSENFSHVFTTAGEYNVSVSVVDSKGARAEASLIVEVTEEVQMAQFTDLVGVEIQQWFDSSVTVDWLADGKTASVLMSGYTGQSVHTGFRVNGASDVTEVHNGDTVTAWHKSSNGYGITLDTTITIGAFSDTFSTTTKATSSTKLPLIVGAPNMSANVNEFYSYTPQISTDYTQFAPATKPFTVANKPDWTTFDTATGTLSGTPTTIGEFTNVKITAYGDDGLDDITFTITVRNDGPYINGSGHSLENDDLSFTFSENSDWRSKVTQVELTSCYTQTVPVILAASDYTFSEGSLKLHVSSSTNVALHIPTMGGGQLIVKSTGYGDSSGLIDYIQDGQYGVKVTATVPSAITEENIDAMVVTLSLSNYLKFEDAILDSSNFSLYGAHDGVTMSGVTYISDTEAELTLAFDGTDFDANTTLQINIANNELNICQSVTANSLTVTAIDEPIWSNLLYPNDPEADAKFGVALDIKNGTVAVSADTGVYIYTKDTLGDYQQVQKIADVEAEDLALDGDYLVVGNGNFYVDGNGLEGRVKVYKKDAGGTYLFITDIAKPTLTTSAHFGASVDISGDLLLIGAYNDDDHKGAAYLYKNNGSDSFTLVETLKRDSGKAQDWFGFDVAIDGNYFVVGSQVLPDIGDDKSELGAGFVNYYNYLSDTLELMHVISPNDSGVLADHFGQSVAISGDHIAIGAPGNNSKGSVYLYKRAFDTATDNGKVLGEIADESFGSSVGIYHNVSNTLAVGTSASGNAYSVVQGSSTSFSKYQSTLAGDDRLGYRVAIDDNEVAFGLFSNDDKANNGGAVLVTNVSESIVQGDDSVANQFSLLDVSGVELSSVVEANATIHGINQTVNISIENGEYSLDNRDTWSEANATVENDQVVYVRHTTSDEYNVATTTTLSVGAVSATFTSTTKLEAGPDLTGTVSSGSLMWEDTIHTRDSSQTWSVSYDYCKDLVLADFDDWRLPNFNWESELNELGTIMTDSNSSAAEEDRVINEPFVLITKGDDIWSWTNEAQGDSEHVVGIFTGGPDNFDGMSNTSELKVRCVRDITE